MLLMSEPNTFQADITAGRDSQGSQEHRGHPGHEPHQCNTAANRTSHHGARNRGVGGFPLARRGPHTLMPVAPLKPAAKHPGSRSGGSPATPAKNPPGNTTLLVNSTICHTPTENGFQPLWEKEKKKREGAKRAAGISLLVLYKLCT